MVALPLFKLGSLLLRQVSKYGANRIKIQAHEHPKFRKIAARYGQMIHQFNMRMSVTALRDVAAERRAKELQEAPTVKTEEQTKADEAAKEKQAVKAKEAAQEASQSVWKRKFKPLREDKAVDLFADFIGDAFILAVASALILYEYARAKSKPDPNVEKFEELEKLLKEEQVRIEELESVEKERQKRIEALEEALELLKTSPKKK